MFRLAMLVASGVGMPLTAINGPATASAPAVRLPVVVVGDTGVGEPSRGLVLACQDVSGGEMIWFEDNTWRCDPGSWDGPSDG
jgi:hypothetical protein